MMTAIPTEKGWRSEPWDLDIPFAYRHFAGKSVDEAARLFEKDAVGYQEDLMFMPTVCFQYYLNAYTQYLLSDASRGDSDGASCFFGLVGARHAEMKACDDRTRSQVAAVLDRLSSLQDWFDAEKAIYGDFKKKVEHARTLTG